MLESNDRRRRVRRRPYHHGLITSLWLAQAAQAPLVSSTNANPNPFRLEQPDGTESPPIILTGSPHFHQLESEDGYTVLEDAADGFLKYGALDPSTGEVVPTTHKLGAVDETKEMQQNGRDTMMRFSVLFDGDTLPPSESPTQSPTIDSPEPQLVARSVLVTMAGGSGSYGNQFDIKAVRDIEVTRFDVHSRTQPSDPPMTIEVYTKAGSFRGSEYEESSWEQICCTRPIQSAGIAKRTPIPKDAFYRSVSIEAGQSQAFYITATEPVIRYTKGKGQVGDIVNGNLDIQVLAGSGVGFYPFGQHAENRVFNGAVHYETFDIVRQTAEESASSNYATPLAEPTLWPTGSVPTPMPSSVKTLQTSSFAGNVGSYGIQFDVLSLKATTIKSLSFHTDRTTLTSVQVYFRRGSYVGVERDASAWKLICDTQVLGRGYMNLTPIREKSFRPQTIDAAETVALYVTLSSPNLRYSKADIGATAGGDNNDLYIYPGAGVGGFLFGPTIAPRLFDGLLKYEVIEAPTPAPTLQPTVSIPADITTNEQEIIMTMSSGNGGYGAMFDVTAKPGRTLVVRTLDIHTDTLSDVQVKVYVVSGAYAPHSYDSEAWSLICETTVRGEGYFQRTRLPERDFAKIAIPGGETRGFYVSLSSKNLRYSDVSAVGGRRRLRGRGGDGEAEDMQVGSVWAESRDVQLKVGAGLALDDWSGLYEPRVFNGGLVFTCIGDDCEEEDEGTTSRPTRQPVSLNPTSLAPTAHPTPFPSIHPTPAPKHVLMTTMAGGSGACGNIFDVKKSDNVTGIEITSIDVYTDRKYHIEVEVWTRVGTALGRIPFPDPSWTLVAKTIVLGAGESEFTPLPPSEFVPVQLLESVPVRGFLVFALTPDIRYTPNRDRAYETLASDSNICRLRIARTSSTNEGVGRSLSRTRAFTWPFAVGCELRLQYTAARAARANGIGLRMVVSAWYWRIGAAWRVTTIAPCLSYQGVVCGGQHEKMRQNGPSVGTRQTSKFAQGIEKQLTEDTTRTDNS